MLEIVVEIFWFALAIWLIKKGYEANKKAEPFTIKSIFEEKKVEQGLDAMFYARGFVIGIGMLILLTYKLLTCGLVCGVI